MARGYQTPKSGMHKWTKDLTGKVFGQLRVIEFSGYKGKPTRHAHWMCICTCGEEREVRATRLIHGQITACVTCSHAIANARSADTRSLEGDEAAFRKLCDVYRRNAAKRSIEFDLEENYLRLIFKGNCYYCGAEPSQICKSRSGRSEFTYNGIDRVKNSIGYVESNVVPCCPLCNYAKREMEADEFLAWIRRVYEYAERNNNA